MQVLKLSLEWASSRSRWSAASAAAIAAAVATTSVTVAPVASCSGPRASTSTALPPARLGLDAS